MAGGGEPGDGEVPIPVTDDCKVKVFDIIASLYVICQQYTYDQIHNGPLDGEGSTVDDIVVGCCLTDSYDLETLVADICYIYRIERKFTKGGLYIYRNRDLNDPATVALKIKAEELVSDNTGGDVRTPIKTIYDSSNGTVTQLAFNFLDADNDYKINQMTAKRPEAKRTDTIKQVSLPFVMHLKDAEKLVNRVLSDGRLQLIRHTFRLPPKFAYIGKGDVLEIDHGTFADVVRIMDVDFNADKSQSCTAETVSTGSIEIKTVTHPQSGYSIGGAGVDSEGMVFDIPLIHPGEKIEGDNIFEYYMGLFPRVPGSWKGGYFALKVGDEAYSTVFYAQGAPAKGEVMLRWVAGNKLQNKKWVTDTDKIALTGGSNPWNTNFNVDKGYIDSHPLRNIALYGKPGRWEIIQFEGIANGYMYGVVRGLRGTDVNCGNHQVGDYVITANPGMSMITLPQSAIGKQVKYKAVSNDRYFEKVQEQTDPYTLQGNSRRAFAPYRFKGVRESNGDLTFSWVRRDKLFSGWGKPLGNSEGGTENFEVSIALPNSGSIVRTVAATGSSVVYSSDQQSQDATGGLTAFMLRISQIGTIGRGFTGVEVVDV